MFSTYLRLGCVMVAVAILSAGSNAAVEPLKSDEIRFRFGNPKHLAVASSGALWATFGNGALVQVARDGRRRVFATRDYGDVARGLDGAIWTSSTGVIRRVDPSGRVTRWQFADETQPVEPLSVSRTTTWVGADVSPGAEIRYLAVVRNGRLRQIAQRQPVFVSSYGAAAGPRGSLWLAEAGLDDDVLKLHSSDAIARITPAGVYKRFPLPTRHGGPVELTWGPDGAVWFTEPNLHRIGRMTTTGNFSEYALPGRLRPTNIIRAGNALWFSADQCLGRISRSGTVTTWRLSRGDDLGAIADAPDGSIWAAELAPGFDKQSGVVHHFVPNAAPRAGCSRRIAVRRARAVRAELEYSVHPGWGTAIDLRLRISRGQGAAFVASIALGTPDEISADSNHEFAVRDLDGNGEPEVILDLYTGGCCHCCNKWRIYRYDPPRATYTVLQHMWGNSSSDARLRDVNGDRRPELLSTDDRFAYAFTSYAESGRPIQIWRYENGRLVDVTRRFPRSVREDARDWWRFYLKYRSRQKTDKDQVRGVLGPWAADQYLLGHRALVHRVLKRQVRLGHLSSGGAAGLEQFLEQLGY